MLNKKEIRLYMVEYSCNFSELLGKTLTKVEVDSDEELILFTCSDGSKYAFFHSKVCCEKVTLKQIDGDFDDLLKYPLLMAEEVSKKASKEESKEFLEKHWNADWTYYKYWSAAWTFYKLATVKGYVTIQWFGSSNGRYSIGAELYKIKI